MMGGRGRAEMADPSGPSELAEFIGDGDQLLRFTHMPDSRIGSIMICSSVSAEFMKNYRREVRLARALAKAGFLVTRLHYRGMGNSAGEPSLVSLHSLSEDVRSVAGEATGYVGTRLGGVIAALAAPPHVPLVLWEPPVNGERWFKEAIRAAVISRAARQKAEGENHPTVFLERLESEGKLDVLGFGLHKGLVDGARSLKLEDVLASRSGPVLIVQIGMGPVRPANQQLIDGLKSDGVDISIVTGGRDVAWWFERGGARDFEPDLEIIEPTVGWLTEHSATM